MRFLYVLILSFAPFSTMGQQWVLDEIADELKTSESISVWLIVLLLIIGYFLYKYAQKKDDEADEQREKEKRIEEKERIEEVLREYRERHENDIDTLYLDDDIIVPVCHNQVNHESTTESSQAKTEEQLSNIETDQYILSPNGKEFIKAKDCDTLIIPNGVEVIKFEAFIMCKIKEITIPHSVRTIEDLAFSGCSIEKVHIPNSIENFGELIFSGCRSLTEVVFENGLRTFGIGMFHHCMSLKNIVLPDTLISIPNSAFDGCVSLNDIILPCKLKRIGDDAFCDCQSLKEISIPSSVNDIGFSAFRSCALSEIVIPNQIYGISEYMFFNDYCLKKVVLPNTITCIMSYAFYGCQHLHIVIPPSVSYIAPDAFFQCNDYSYEDLRIEVPKGKKELLEKICDKLIGKVFEYEVTEDMKIPSNIYTHKNKFVDTHIFKEKENLKNEEPMFYYGAQIVFEYNNNCTYDNFMDVMHREEAETEMDSLDLRAEKDVQNPISDKCLDFSHVQVPDEKYFRDRKKEYKEFVDKFIKKQEDKFFPVGSIEEKLQSLSREAIVDLGLSVKWCSKNIGATEIYDLGYQFRWGCLDPIKYYDEDKNTHYAAMPYAEGLVNLDMDISGDAHYDAATKYSNGECRTPTKSECEELIEKCNWKYVEVDKYKGFIITGPSGNSIYLPLSYSSFVNCMDIVMMTVRETYMTSTPDTTRTLEPEFEEVFGFKGYTYKLHIENSDHKTERFTQRINCFSKNGFSPIRGVSKL